MKIAIEIDCTPEEAREMLGLPDLKDLQGKWLEKTQEAILANPAQFTADQLIERWTKSAAPGLDLMNQTFGQIMSAAQVKPGKDKP